MTTCCHVSIKTVSENRFGPKQKFSRLVIARVAKNTFCIFAKKLAQELNSSLSWLSAQSLAGAKETCGVCERIAQNIAQNFFSK
jgi:hypothetical protein